MQFQALWYLLVQHFIGLMSLITHRLTHYPAGTEREGRVRLRNTKEGISTLTGLQRDKMNRSRLQGSNEGTALDSKSYRNLDVVT